MSNSTAVISLHIIALSAKGTSLADDVLESLQTFTKPGFSSIALVASWIA